MVLDDLYCGNIYPAEQVVPHKKEYRKLHTGKCVCDLQDPYGKADHPAHTGRISGYSGECPLF